MKFNEAYARNTAMEFQAVLDAARALSVEEQIRLIDLIQEDWHQAGFDPDLTPELMQGLDRKFAEHKADHGSAIPWETVLAEALERHKQ